MTDSTAGSRNRTILVVDTRLAALRRTSDLLRRAGHYVIEAASFDEAKRGLVQQQPAVLISGLRLAAFNGLHLVHLARLTRPELNAIIMAASADTVLQAEAERVGASLLVEPVPPSALLSLISQMTDERSSLDDLRLAFERRAHVDRRHMAVDGFWPDRRVGERRVAVAVSALHRDRRPI